MKKNLFIYFLFALSSASIAQTGTVSIAPAPTICTGSNVTLSAIGFTAPTISKWQYSSDNVAWTDISSSASATLILNNVSASRWYRAIATSSLTPTGSSLLTVDAASSGILSSGATVCSGSNSGTVSLSSGTFTNINYWEYSTGGSSGPWITIANTSVSENYNDLTATTSYRANITNGTCPAANTAAAAITVNPVSIGGVISGAASECAGTNSGTLTLSGLTGTMIRWQYSTDEGISWTNIANTSVANNYTNLSQTTAYRAVVQSGVCAAENSGSAIITVAPESEGGTVSGNSNACSGLNHGVVTLSGYVGSIIRWEQSTDGEASWAAIANTSDSYTYDNITTTTKFRAVVQSSNCTSANSSAATIIVHPVSGGGTVSGSDSVCSGTNSGTLSLSGYAGNILKWESSNDGGISWDNISNTTPFCSYSNLTQTTTFRAIVQSGSCAAAISSSATLAVIPVSIGGTISGSTTVCSGNNGATLQLTNYTGTILHWESSINGGTTWSTISNTSDTLSYLNLSSKTLHRALVQSGSCAAKYSATATVSVNSPSAGGVASGNDTVCSGNNGATLHLSGYTGNILRWQSSVDGGAAWSNIFNTTPSCNYSNLTQTTLFRAVVQNGLCPTENSGHATITVLPVPDGGTLNDNASVCSGNNNGTLILSGYSGKIMNWESSVNNGATWNKISNPSDTLSYSNLNATTFFRVVVQNGSCIPKYSTAAIITVNTPSVGGTVSGADTVCAGTNSGTLTLSGYTGSIVRWQSSTDGGVSWNNISNSTAHHNYSNISTTTNYRAVIQNGNCPAMNSSDAIICVFPLSAGGTLSPATYAACAVQNGGTMSLSGNSGNVIGWESSVDGGVSWIPIANTTSAQNFQNLQQTTWYRVIVQNGKCAAAYSSLSMVSVFSPSVGGNVSGSDTVCTGTNSGSLTLNGYTGNILNWESSANGGTSWTHIANTAAIQNYMNLSNTNLYRATLQNGSCAAANSSAGKIMVSPATAGGAILSDALVCDSTSSGILFLSGHTGSILTWEYSVNNGNNWIAIPDTSSSYIFSGIKGETWYRANVQSGACSAASSSPAVVSLAPAAVASFSISVNGATVLFKNTSTGSVTNIWHFGDNASSTMANPAHTYLANGTYQVMLIVTDSCGSDTAYQTVTITGLGIGEFIYNNPDIKIFPNPFSSETTWQITHSLNEDCFFVLVDLFGKELRKILIPAGVKNTIISRNDLPAGIYFYRLIADTKTIATGKVMIE